MLSFRLLSEKDQKAWEQFIVQKEFSLSYFLQSWKWGEFQASVHHPVFRVGIERHGELQLIAQIIVLHLPFRQKIFYIPRGPIIKNGFIFQDDQYNLWKIFIEGVRGLAKKNRVLFLRIDPPFSENDGAFFLQKFGFIKAYRDIQPRETLCVNLLLSEQEILFGLKQKTRYNIRLAQRHGVEIEVCFPDDREKIKFFLDLLEKTSLRDGFSLHPRDYYKKMGEIFSLNGEIKLFLAKKNSLILAGALVGFFQNIAIYLHGGSDHSHRSLMGPFLLHWEILQYAKNLGCKTYDLNGIQSKNNRKNNWEGITRFKMGFAPEAEVFQTTGTWEFPFYKFLYAVYRTRERIIR